MSRQPPGLTGPGAWPTIGRHVLRARPRRRALVSPTRRRAPLVDRPDVGRGRALRRAHARRMVAAGRGALGSNAARPPGARVDRGACRGHGRLAGPGAQVGSEGALLAIVPVAAYHGRDRSRGAVAVLIASAAIATDLRADQFVASGAFPARGARGTRSHTGASDAPHDRGAAFSFAPATAVGGSPPWHSSRRPAGGSTGRGRTLVAFGVLSPTRTVARGARSAGRASLVLPSGCRGQLSIRSESR
jgi:hypothetical protein